MPNDLAVVDLGRVLISLLKSPNLQRLQGSSHCSSDRRFTHAGGLVCARRKQESQIAAKLDRVKDVASESRFGCRLLENHWKRWVVRAGGQTRFLVGRCNDTARVEMHCEM